MTIHERFNELRPYLIGVRYVEGVLLVDAVFRDHWVIPDSEIITKTRVDESTPYYAFFSDKKGITVDNILDHVKAIIDANIEREKKHQLLKKKVQELKEVFGTNSLDKLEKMKFAFSGPDLEDEFDLDIPDAPEKETPKPKRDNPQNATPQNLPELPPKKEKIELEDHDLPEEATQGECDCGPNEACPKCIDRK